jgi:hypothetical protein
MISREKVKNFSHPFCLNKENKNFFPLKERNIWEKTSLKILQKNTFLAFVFKIS